jgi:hypothetical protein
VGGSEGAGGYFADGGVGFGGGRDERRAKYTGVHASGVVEPDSDRGVGTDVGDRGVQQFYDRVLPAASEAALGAVDRDAGSGVDFVFADCGY